MNNISAPANKVEFYARYLLGEFGNRPRTWANWPDLRDSDYAGRVTIRDTERGGLCVYGVRTGDLRSGVWPAGAKPGSCRFNESMPDADLAIQGNLWWSETGLRLEYSTEPGIGHRQAVRQPHMRQAEGILAHSLLDHHLDPCSRADLEALAELYPDAVVEFSTYAVKVGLLPHRNTVWWEVRNY